MNTYTVGVKRRFLPGFKKYQVVKHFVESTLPIKNEQGQIIMIREIEPRLIMIFLDGSELSLPFFKDMTLRAYPDYLEFHGLKKPQPKPEEQASEPVGEETEKVIKLKNKIKQIKHEI